jgi:regulator of sirC expression with transglutaminase-like and TPR domain
MESSPDMSGLRVAKVGLAKFRDTKAQFKDFYLGTNAPSSRRHELAPDIAELTRQIGQSKSDAELVASLEKAGANQAALLDRAGQLDKEAYRLRRVASVLHERSIEKALVAALEGPEEKIDLFHAALLIAKLDNPEVDTDAYRSELARMADELKASLANSTSDTSKLAALTRFLFIDNGFHGSWTDYYNRANSYLNEVMDDREGLPITLAVLYLELAGQIGLTNVVGLPVPTHFMVLFRPAKGAEQIIDVFDQGKVLTRSQAVELVADSVDSVGENDFKPAQKREIITRMLRNLLGIAQRRGNVNDAARYMNVILALNPESAADRLNRARLQMQRGENAAAKADVQWLIEHEPAGIDLERLTELYRSL